MTADAPERPIDEEQEELIDEFAFFDDWMQRYEYLIDLGRKLPPLDEAYKRDEFKLKGCQSQVWLVGEKRGDRLVFHAISDAAIVSGIIALLLRVYSTARPRRSWPPSPTSSPPSASTPICRRPARTGSAPC